MPLSSALRRIPVGRRTWWPPALLLLVRLFIFSETARIGVLHGLRHDGCVIARVGEKRGGSLYREGRWLAARALSQLSNAGSAVRQQQRAPGSARHDGVCISIGVLLCMGQMRIILHKPTEDWDPSEIRSHSQHWIRSCYKIGSCFAFHQRPSDTKLIRLAVRMRELHGQTFNKHHCVADLLSAYDSRVSHCKVCTSRSSCSKNLHCQTRWTYRSIYVRAADR